MPEFMTTVVAPATYNTAPDISLSFQPDQFVFRADSGDFLLSFDGVNDHGLVKAADLVPLYVFCKNKKVWFKQSGGASTARTMCFTRV